MKLSSLIEKDLVLVKQNIRSREEAIELAIDSLYEKHRINFDKRRIVDEIISRDKLGGTVFKTGMAIPHARIKDYDDLSIIICIPEKAVDVEGVNVSCFVVMITSVAVSNLYLQVLSTLAKISKDRDFFKKLINSEDASRIYKLLGEIEVKKDLTVEDIMSTDYGTVDPDMTLKELTDKFYIKKTSYFPVLSIAGEFLGEVRINDLISVGIPDYAVAIGDLGFLHSFAPLEKLMNEEESITVGSIMKKSLVSLAPDSSIIEAAMKMSQGNFRHLPVIESGRLVGILNVMDILNKILRR